MEAEVLAADTVLAQVLDDSGSESMETELLAACVEGPRTMKHAVVSPASIGISRVSRS